MSITTTSRVPVDDQQKSDTEFVEKDIGLPEAGAGKPINEDDLIAAAALVPIGGIRFTPDELKIHRRINMKYDLTVLPLLTLLYLFNGLDRSNLGNAATVAFYKDIGIPATSVNTATVSFYATFVAFMPLSVWLGKLVGYHRWIPTLMIGWGIFTVAHAFIKNEAQLYAFRLMIGVFEAGYYPSVAYYFASCYIRFDFALRIATFYGSYSIAGAFSSIIAYGILQLKGNLHSWQYLFIIEGAATIGLAILAYFFLPSHASKAWFLNADEKAFAVDRMLRDSGGEDYQEKGISKRDVILAFTDWKIWLLWPANTVSGLPSSAFGVFLPLIVQSLGYESYYANLYAVPIYVVGCAGLVMFAWLSDRLKARMWVILVALGVVILGLILVFVIKSPHGRYAALCIMQIGNFATAPIIVAILANNTPRPGHRAMIFSINSMGNVGGIISAASFRVVSDTCETTAEIITQELFPPKYGPSYAFPFKVSLGLACFAWVEYLAYYVIVKAINRWRRNKVAGMTREEIQEENTSHRRVGDKKWTFQYTT